MAFLFSSAKSQMVAPDAALPARSLPLRNPRGSRGLGTPLRDLPETPWPAGLSVIYLGMGCFWGAEEIYWRLPGVYVTSVAIRVATRPPDLRRGVHGPHRPHRGGVHRLPRAEITTYDVLKHFWESHDPTQGYRQGNDTGTQYRSAVYYTTDAQREMVERTSAAYAGVIAERGYGDITTQIAPAADWPYYFAEAYHQQYLYKVPNGYRCHANTGLVLPAL